MRGGILEPELENLEDRLRFIIIVPEGFDRNQ